ncbi:DNA-binding transcriptional regulator, MocR family, contains an aminotransferase domain [Paracidovorax cattleyae]|uniref:DNA-binding transcriptional regulator, MocR family, contains an aminotransferase domain n=2 Tax=Paracidovorax cattleyae TaxID=80868 RepID=A0A1H0Q2K4_9BURK|nr:DNA-binding transcriptional regulator, MocR family, contains an aminotransferase domain [Paracidovorax cattleyae]
MGRVLQEPPAGPVAALVRREGEPKPLPPCVAGIVTTPATFLSASSTVSDCWVSGGDGHGRQLLHEDADRAVRPRVHGQAVARDGGLGGREGARGNGKVPLRGGLRCCGRLPLLLGMHGMPAVRGRWSGTEPGGASGEVVDNMAEILRKDMVGEINLNRWDLCCIRLPSVRAMAASMDISNETVLRAYDKLAAAGYLEARRGSGFYVSTEALQVGKPAPPQRWNGPPAQNAWDHLLHSRGADGDSALGTLPAEWIGTEVLSGALRSLAARPHVHLSEYADRRGWLPLREALVAKLSMAGIGATPDQIVSTAGATDAVDLVDWSFLYQGQYAVVEEPAPYIHTQRLLASGVWILRVRRLDDGPDLEQLAQLCEKYQPKAFFCSSMLQNPTSTSLSPRKAHQLLKLAEQYGMWIVDDDTYGDLLPRSKLESVTRLAALDHFERVIHIGSFSKTVAPALRCGFLVASHRCLERLLLMRSVGSIHSSLLTDQIVCHALTEGDYEQHCGRLQKKLAASGKALLAKIRARGWQAIETGAGMYLWMSPGEGVDGPAVWQALAAQGVMVASETVFMSDGTGSHMRLNIARTDHALLDRIADAIASTGRAAPPAGIP